MHWLDLSVLVLYTGLLLGLGFYRSTQVGKDPESYLLAGRKLSLPGIVITLVATWYGGILGIGEKTYLVCPTMCLHFFLPFSSLEKSTVLRPFHFRTNSMNHLEKPPVLSAPFIF